MAEMLARQELVWSAGTGGKHSADGVDGGKVVRRPGKPGSQEEQRDRRTNSR